MKRKRSSPPRGIVLLEVMLGVTIFSMGILALGSAVNNCLDGQAALREAARARLALSNRMSAVLAGAVRVDEATSEPLEGEGTGITLKTSAVPLAAEDEDGNQVTGISVVTLAAEWRSGNEPQLSDLTFYLLDDANAAQR